PQGSWPGSHRQEQQPARPARDPGDDRQGPPPGAGRGGGGVKVHDLKPAAGSSRDRRRVGRGIGGKGGKTAGRGTKGQNARNSVARGFEGGQTGLKQRVPKLKGFNNPFRVEYSPVNLDQLEQIGAKSVDPASLVASGHV